MEKRPKKKEVIKYFENAETVECLCNKKEYNITNPKKEIHKEDDDYWITTENDDVLLWSKYRRGYAKILSYKKPKDFTITKEQISDIFKLSSLEGKKRIKMLFPSVFEEEKKGVGCWEVV